MPEPTHTPTYFERVADWMNDPCMPPPTLCERIHGLWACLWNGWMYDEVEFERRIRDAYRRRNAHKHPKP